jgi:hypothetical protein
LKAVESATTERRKASCHVKKVSRRTIKRLEKSIDIITGNGELTTNARAVTIADIRNTVSFATMNSAVNLLHINPAFIQLGMTTKKTCK